LQPSQCLASRSVRSKARLFHSSCEFVPHPQLPVTDSPAVLPSVVMLCPARYSPLRSASSLRRDCPHSAPASLQRTDSATLRSFPRSHQSLPADSSFVADCFQSLLPLPLQTASLPLRCSPRVGGRTRPYQRTANGDFLRQSLGKLPSLASASVQLHPPRTASWTP